jgi:hypothetical protein
MVLSKASCYVHEILSQARYHVHWSSMTDINVSLFDVLAIVPARDNQQHSKVRVASVTYRSCDIHIVFQMCCLPRYMVSATSSCRDRRSLISTGNSMKSSSRAGNNASDFPFSMAFLPLLTSSA